MKAFRVLTGAILMVLLGACTSTKEAPPPVSPDGLELIPSTRAAAVYRLPGETLTGYKEFGLAPCQVAFRKDWLRDQNRSRMDLSNRITQKDVDEIKDKLGELCHEEFRKALEADPPYKLVESFNEGEDVLVIIPAIVNLDVAAPDLQTAGRSRTYTTSSGSMTLVIELKDGTSGQVLARAIDGAAAPDYGHMQWTNGVTNRGDASRMLEQWAKRLREAFDAAVK